MRSLHIHDLTQTRTSVNGELLVKQAAWARGGTAGSLSASWKTEHASTTQVAVAG